MAIKEVAIHVGFIYLGLFLVIELALYPRGLIFGAIRNEAAEMLNTRRETVSDALIQELRAIHAEEIASAPSERERYCCRSAI